MSGGFSVSHWLLAFTSRHLVGDDVLQCVRELGMSSTLHRRPFILFAPVRRNARKPSLTPDPPLPPPLPDRRLYSVGVGQLEQHHWGLHGE